VRRGKGGRRCFGRHGRLGLGTARIVASVPGPAAGRAAVLRRRRPPTRAAISRDADQPASPPETTSGRSAVGRFSNGKPTAPALGRRQAWPAAARGLSRQTSSESGPPGCWPSTGAAVTCARANRRSLWSGTNLDSDALGRAERRRAIADGWRARASDSRQTRASGGGRPGLPRRPSPSGGALPRWSGTRARRWCMAVARPRSRASGPTWVACGVRASRRAHRARARPQARGGDRSSR
jgi:hypothetical protein